MLTRPLAFLSAPDFPADFAADFALIGFCSIFVRVVKTTLPWQARRANNHGAGKGLNQGI